MAVGKHTVTSATSKNCAGVAVNNGVDPIRSALMVAVTDAEGNQVFVPVQEATHAFVRIPAASLTSTSFAVALANSAATRIFTALNTTDEGIWLSLDAGVTEMFYLPALTSPDPEIKSSVSMDYAANGLEGPDEAVHYKVGSTPTVGELVITLVS